MKGCPTMQSLQTVVTCVGKLSPCPDLLLLTGDLSQDETRASYEHLHALLSPLGIPAYWLAGNHDQSLADMAMALDTPPISAQKCFQRGDWNFVLLNTMMTQQVQGCLTADTLEWLEQQLCQNADLPTLVALHHHPLPIASAWMDAIALQNPDDLFAVLDRHPQVKLVLFGHIHQEFDQWRNGVRYLGAPSTCIQFLPKSEAIALDLAGPGFRLLKLDCDGSHQTWIERVPFEY